MRLGGESLKECLEFVHDGGRLAYPNGVEPEPKRRPKLRVISYDAEANPRAFAELERAVEEAELVVPIAEVTPWSERRRPTRGWSVGPYWAESCSGSAVKWADQFRRATIFTAE